jgi:hypothetical protein
MDITVETLDLEGNWAQASEITVSTLRARVADDCTYELAQTPALNRCVRRSNRTRVRTLYMN